MGRRVWGGGGVGGGGIGVCDCQLWERDPPGGVKVQENRKKEQKIEKKREQVGEGMGGKRRRRNERECCFDVKGDGQAVVRRAGG